MEDNEETILELAQKLIMLGAAFFVSYVIGYLGAFLAITLWRAL